MADFPTIPEYRADLATSYMNLGEAYYVMAGNWDAAGEPLQKALDLSRKLVADYPKVTRYQWVYGGSLVNRGEYLLVRGRNLDEACQLLEEAASYLRPLAKSFPQNPYYPGYLIFSYEFSSTALALLGKQAQAEEKQQQAEKALKDTVAAFQNASGGPAAASFYCLRAGDGWRGFANISNSLGRSKEALVAYGRAVHWYSKGIELDPENARLFISRGATYGALGKSENAVADFKRAAAVAEKLAAEFPEPGYRSVQAESYIWVGNVLKESGRISEAEQAYRRALALLEELAAEFPDMPIFRRQLETLEQARQGLESKSNR